MVFIFIFGAAFFIPCWSMNTFSPHDSKYNCDLMPRFEPSPEASKYKPLQHPRSSYDLAAYAPNVPSEKRKAFVACMEAPRASHLDINTLKFVLEDPALVEAVIAYEVHYESRNEFIELFFFSSIMWGKADTYRLLLEKKIDLSTIRSTYNETPAEFVRKLTEKK
jgi:hypothetical protein